MNEPEAKEYFYKVAKEKGFDDTEIPALWEVFLITQRRGRNND